MLVIAVLFAFVDGLSFGMKLCRTRSDPEGSSLNVEHSCSGERKPEKLKGINCCCSYISIAGVPLIFLLRNPCSRTIFHKKKHLYSLLISLTPHNYKSQRGVEMMNTKTKVF